MPVPWILWGIRNTYQSLIHNAGLDSPRSNQKLFPGDSFVVSEQRKGAKRHSSWKQRWSFSLPKITNEDHEVRYEVHKVHGINECIQDDDEVRWLVTLFYQVLLIWSFWSWPMAVDGPNPSVFRKVDFWVSQTKTLVFRFVSEALGLQQKSRCGNTLCAAMSLKMWMCHLVIPGRCLGIPGDPLVPPRRPARKDRLAPYRLPEGVRLPGKIRQDQAMGSRVCVVFFWLAWRGKFWRWII